MEDYHEQYRLLGLRIAYYRAIAGWTQEEFADKVGYSLGFISRIESNNGKKIAGISLPMLFRISEVLGISVVQLLENTENREREGAT